MAEAKSPTRQAADRIGEYISRGFTNYFEHWQEWIVPMIIAAVVMIGATLCCVLPSLFVAGPVQCGLFYCAFAALRNERVDTTVFNRTWDAPGSSILASLFITLVTAAPILLLYGVFALVICLVSAAAAPATPPPGGAGPPVFVVPSEESQPPDAFPDERDRSQPQVPRGPGGGRAPPGGAGPVAGPLFFGGILLFYLAMFVFMFLIWIWQLWFTTRMMFVFPLIAQRGLGAGDAIRASWKETRTRFWELLAANFVASIISMVGIYALYVGALFTVPMGVTILALVYLDRFERPSAPAAEPAAPAPPEG